MGEKAHDVEERTLVLPVRLDATPRGAIERAAELLRAGRLVAFPTETVYGLGADATNAAAVERIFAAKERPYSDPLIVHVPDAGAVRTVARDAPGIVAALGERFWPGPLTLILRRAAVIPGIVAAGGDTVGVRVPDHAVARALLEAAGVPVAAPSANRFMHTSPTTAAHVLADLAGRIACVLDAGPCAVGVESTVLDVTANPPRVLRPGGVTLEALREVAPDTRGPDGLFAPRSDDAEGAAARAPGQMERHYAPRTRLVVFDAQGERALAAVRAEVEAALGQGERVGALLPDDEAEALAGLMIAVARLGPGDDLAGITRRLYAALRELDAAGLDVIVAHTFGTSGMGLALWDRLRRAAGGTLRAV
ncbi:MAG TPA: L-threonylcarbamoyladenylate synthase [Ktedonobacterales bacterium]|nr:L-threonylcarbamoyladenylate synthase [Ktedonobacterales bacterium]